MSEQLDKEEAGLTTDRGLEGCPPGLQAFEMFVSATFRKKYDKVGWRLHIVVKSSSWQVMIL